MDSTRRDFLTAGAIIGGTMLAGSMVGQAQEDHPNRQKHSELMKRLIPGAVDEAGNYVLPPLPYAYDALAEVIDPETMKLHHDKHHDAYVKGLIKAEEELAKSRESGDFSLVQHWSRLASFNGGGHFLHCIFWDCMAPPSETGEPSSQLGEAIQKNFGSVDAMLNHLKAASKAVEGAGWGLMAYSIAAGKLVILQAQNQQLLTQWGIIPLIGIDVWEHAYYLKYQNNRAAYVDAFPKIINWKSVSERYGMLAG